MDPRSLMGGAGAGAPRPTPPRPATQQTAPSHQQARAAAIASIRAHIGAQRLQEAYQEATAYVSRHKKDPEAHFLLAHVYEKANNTKLAIQHAEISLKMVPNADTYMILARVYRTEGESDRSLEATDRALELRPDHLPTLVFSAGTLEESGRYAESRAIVDPLVEQLTSNGQAIPLGLQYQVAKLLVQEKSLDEAVAAIDEILSGDSTPEDAQRLAFLLRAKACDRAKNYDDAFESAGRGNRIGQLDFDPSIYEEQVSTLIEYWSPEQLAKYPRTSCTDELPVFVAGMPRSGTSLIDQIIDAHPLAAGVGELASIEAFAMNLSREFDPDLDPPACFGRATPEVWDNVAHDYVKDLRKRAPKGAQRVVNKALGNNKLVGLLACLFPKTRIIHAQRDPRDVAISCYMGGFNNALHPWTTKIEWAARAWEQSARMMQHWRDTLDVPILDVHYERLVSDPDTEFPRLIEFLGLEWDDACRDFHTSRRTVRTLSYDQVNRPLYTSSVNRYERYAKHIVGVEFPAYDAS